MVSTLRPHLWEALTGEPVDPAAQARAAVEFARIKHAKVVNHRQALREVVNRQLAEAL